MELHSVRQFLMEQNLNAKNSFMINHNFRLQLSQSGIWCVTSECKLTKNYMFIKLIKESILLRIFFEIVHMLTSTNRGIKLLELIGKAV